MYGLDACCGTVLDRAELRRRRIIEAARNLFVCNGFHATGVAQIAKASGVAVGQIYRDFEAKEEIVAAIVEGDCARLLERESLHRAVESGDVDAVWRWIRQFIQPTVDREAIVMFAEIIAESTRNHRIAAIFDRTRADVGVSLLSALVLLAPGDEIADRRALLAELILTLSLGLKQRVLLQPDLGIDQQLDTMMAGIRRAIDQMKTVSA